MIQTEANWWTMADARCIVDPDGDVHDRATSIEWTPFVTKSTKELQCRLFFMHLIKVHEEDERDMQTESAIYMHKDVGSCTFIPPITASLLFLFLQTTTISKEYERTKQLIWTSRYYTIQSPTPDQVNNSEYHNPR